MRTENSLKNISLSIINTFVINILRFISRTIFIKILGETYLGVNGLLSNVLGILSLADLGISTAISFSLYKPLAENDKEKIKTLMYFYKKAYFIIGTIVLILGLILLPFLDFFIKGDHGIELLNVYYLVFLANMVIGYYFSYKRTLMIADQKEYKITKITIIFNLILTIAQIIVLFIFKNYLIYLLIQTLTILIENLFVNNYINSNYEYLKEKNIEKMDKNELSNIKKSVKGLIYHKIGTYFVDSTDNLIISKFVGLSAVGLYSNYYLIVNIIYKLVMSSFYSTTSAFGNLNINEKTEKKHDVFKTLYFFSFCLFCICTICFLNLFNHFIGNIWLGNEYLFSFAVVIIISLNFYMNGNMHIIGMVSSSVGLFYKNRYVPLIQSIINIVTSVILVLKFGVLGVLIGTTISSLAPTIINTCILYKEVFKTSSKYYFVEYIKRMLIVIVSGFITRVILINIPVINNYLYLVISLIISILIPTLLIILIYRKSSEYIDFMNRLKKVISNFRSRK